MFEKLISRRKKNDDIPANNAVAGFVVREARTNRIVFREMIDVEGLSVKQESRLSRRREFILGLRYPLPKYVIQTCGCSNPAAFDLYCPP